MKMPVYLNVTNNNVTAQCGPIIAMAHNGRTKKQTIICITGLNNNGDLEGELIPVIDVPEVLDLNELTFEVNHTAESTQMTVSVNNMKIILTIVDNAVEYIVHGYRKTTVYRMDTYDRKVRTIKKCVS